MSLELTTTNGNAIATPTFAAVAAKIYAAVDLGELKDPMPLEEVLRLAELSTTLIEDDLAYTRAAERWKAIKKAEKTVDNWAKPHKDTLNTAKNELMAYIKLFSEPLSLAAVEIDRRMKAYKRKREEDAAAAAKAAAAQAAAEAAAVAPWEEAPTPTAIAVPMVAIPTVAGVSDRKSPHKAKVADKRLALETALKEGNEWMLPYIEFNMPQLNALAKREGDLLKNTWPGIEAYQDSTTVNR
jgi:hypothetical protein